MQIDLKNTNNNAKVSGRQKNLIISTYLLILIRKYKKKFKS